MKLIEFSVTNYRSITQANKIKLQDFTVLVGKNNEGKSNLLRAMNVAMTVLMEHIDTRIPLKIYSRKFSNRNVYSWDKDFPFQYKNRKKGLTSIFSLRFKLDDNELDEFHKETNIRGNSEINVTIKIGKDDVPDVSIPKRGSSSYNQKQELVIKFICKKIKFNYIQAIRTDDMARETLGSLINSKLQELTHNSEYIETQNRLTTLKQRTLDTLAPKLVAPLKTFLPELNDVKIKLLEEDPFFYGYHNPFDIIIDDGIPTSISAKGDGIKSIVSLALLKEIRSGTSGTSIIAIEEPESHLHSGAIHGLIDVINKLSENSQVIITTHNPLFVQRNHLNSNVIVDAGKAKPAKTIDEIRRILGVWTSDNLTNARFVFFVEGDDDRISLLKILPLYSERIAAALKMGILVIKPLHGASNLSHDANDVKGSLCQCCALLDDDAAGRQAAAKAISSSILAESEIKYTKCPGSPEAEFEDCLQPSLYSEILRRKYNVDITKTKNFRGRNKWSERMGAVFAEYGTAWSDSTKMDVKMTIANALPAKIDKKEDVLIPQKSTFLEGVKLMLENMLSEEMS